MILQRICIQNLGVVDRVELHLGSDTNIVSTPYTSEISRAIQLVLGRSASCLPETWVSGGTRIDALVCVSQRVYRVTAQPNPPGSDLCLCAHDGEDREKTEEYLYIVSHCAEQDLCEVFDPHAEKNPLKPIQYLSEDSDCALCELSVRTDGLSRAKTFRAYLRLFIKGLGPETIREGKRYELWLQKDGRYAVRYRDEWDQPILLNESEQVLFRYLCFLRTAEFWQGFEELRNLHSVRKPLLIEDLTEKLDETVDIRDVLDRARRLHRQVILLTT